MNEILCIADMHGDLNVDKVKEIIKKNPRISDIFILGDFSRYAVINKDEGIEEFLNGLKNLNLKIYAIPGNCDSKNILKIFEKYDANFHCKSANFGYYDVLFFGGSNISPFKTPHEYEEDEIYKNLENLFNESSNEKENKKILITHTPPYNTKCDVAGIKHVGSKAIRKIIEKFNPDLNLCSHIHECYGKEDFIGKTKVINIGEFKRTYVVLKIDDKNFETYRFFY